MSSKKILSSQIGSTLKISISGGSHEPIMTLKLQGPPAGFTVDSEGILQYLSERSPGITAYDTPRTEKDIPLIKNELGEYVPLPQDGFIVPASGILEFIVKNENYDSKAYEDMLPRPGHADLPAMLKYKGEVNLAGGGPFSGRMTVMFCIAGAICEQLLATYGINLASRILSIGMAQAPALDPVAPKESPISELMLSQINSAAQSDNSVGGVVEAFATNLPSGLGGPMFNGIESVLSPLLFGIPAVKGVEFGNGFLATTLLGSENNDDFLAVTNDEKIITATNNHGGILGGLSTGMPLIVRVAFKPTPSIAKKQQSVDLKTGKPAELKIAGRHDACIVPRARIVVEAMLAIGLCDIILSDNSHTPLEDNIHGNTKQPPKTPKNTVSPLSDMRAQIDDIDEKIISLLDKRMELASKIGDYKKNANIATKDNLREKEILEKAGGFSEIYQKIFEHSRRLQDTKQHKDK